MNFCHAGVLVYACTTRRRKYMYHREHLTLAIGGSRYCQLFVLEQQRYCFKTRDVSFKFIVGNTILQQTKHDNKSFISKSVV